MEKDLKDYRKSYEKGKLLESDLPANPLELFKSWFTLADESALVEEANAMTLTTVGSNDFPSARVVLLKGFGQDGFTFFTNYSSRKAQELFQNSKCCISFFWPSLEKQIILKGEVTKLSEKESKDYFHTRPRESQLGAHASNQSSIIPSREFLENRLADLGKEFENRDIPKPEDWGGFLFIPENFEFWQGRKSRLHDRIQFSKQGKSWKIERLAP